MNSDARIFLIDDSMVAMEDEKEQIIDRLTRGAPHLDVVSIVGMPGIGKTTIAKMVYTLPLVIYRFHTLAWCSVSQKYDKRAMLLDILSHISYASDEFEGMSYEDLCDILRRCLKGRRYLLVMDDVWSISAWNELRACLPDDNNGSRILLTSRLHDVAGGISRYSRPHCLRLLSDEESWQLLEKKVFYPKGCPPELEDLGKMIASTTKGLPLAIVALAGILRAREPSRHSWEHIAERVGRGVVREISEIFEYSYHDLPETLKACFLYFAAFPKDYQIPVRKLTQLWIAEGLIPERVESMSLEDTAQYYLRDLVNRSLVIVSETRSVGGSKTCRLHDSIQNFCLAKAEEQNFLEQIYRHGWLPTSRSMYLSNYRLSICCGGKVEDLSILPTNPSLGSLLCFQFGYWPSRRLFNCFSSYISGLKDVKVLELDEVFIDESFFSIQLPIHLTYLSVNGAIHCIPPSIADLSKLETLIVKGDEGTIRLPESIWNMTNLRHLQIDDSASLKLPNHMREKNFFTFDNLEFLSSPFLSREDVEKILKALPRLRKLKCFIVQKRAVECSSGVDSYPHLDFQSQLESLRVRYCGFLGNTSSEFNFPLWLKKLTLVHLPWNNICTLARLPNLQVLKILSGSFEEDWCMEDDVSFLKLRVLKLCRLRIRKWDANEDHFPNLEQLVVERCEKLESIPSCFGWIPTLQLIDVKWCSLSLAPSVEQIHEEQMELGNEELKVYISTDSLPQSFRNRSDN